MQTARHGGRAWHPTVAVRQVQFDAQALVDVVEVVDSADQAHLLLHGFQGTQQTATAAHQGGPVLAEVGIQAFNEYRVERLRPLRGVHPLPDQGGGALQQVRLHADHPLPGAYCQAQLVGETRDPSQETAPRNFTRIPYTTVRVLIGHGQLLSTCRC